MIIFKSKYHKSIPLEQIIVDPEVQRAEGVDQRRVGKMAGNFNPDALGTLIVSERADGTYVVLDGMHRRAAALLAGYANSVDCIVFGGLTVAEEASLFLLYNDKKDPSAVSRFRARVTAGEFSAVEINRIVRERGWRIAPQSDVGAIAAVRQLESVYRTAANTQPEGAYPVVLSRTLKILTEAWEYDLNSVSGSMLAGVGQLIGRFGDSVDDKALISKLQRHRPMALIGRARLLKDAQGGVVPAALAKIIAGEYNNRRRTNMLPEWTWIR